jgi:hypothetical protein
MRADLLFFLMLAGYAFGATAAVLSPNGSAARRVPWFEQYLYTPLIAWVNQWALRARAIQSGSAHVYPTYLVTALLGLLAMLLVRGT